MGMRKLSVTKEGIMQRKRFATVLFIALFVVVVMTVGAAQDAKKQPLMTSSSDYITLDYGVSPFFKETPNSVVLARIEQSRTIVIPKHVNRNTLLCVENEGWRDCKTLAQLFPPPANGVTSIW